MYRMDGKTAPATVVPLYVLCENNALYGPCVQVICCLWPVSKPAELAHGPFCTLRVVAKAEYYVFGLLRPPIRCRCRCTSDSLLAFRFNISAPKASDNLYRSRDVTQFMGDTARVPNMQAA